MNAAVTAVYTGPFATDGAHQIFAINAQTEIVKDLTIERRRPFRLRLPTVHKSMGTIPSADKLVDPLHFPDHRLNNLAEEKTTLPENATAILPISAPDAIRSLFEHAEKQTESRTEITAQHAFGLLQRIKLLTVEISPSMIHSRMFASMDEEDGSTAIEWIRSRSRIGFVIDQERESSWFVVLPDGTSKSGYLYGNNGLKSLCGLLKEFLTASE